MLGWTITMLLWMKERWWSNDSWMVSAILLIFLADQVRCPLKAQSSEFANPMPGY